MLWIAFLIVTAPSAAPVIRDRCDVIEVNHFHDEHAIPVFTQVIFWDWSPEKKKHVVVAWQLMKDGYATRSPEDHAKYTAAISDYVRRFPAEDQFSLRERLGNRGEFIGGDMWPEPYRGGYRCLWHDDSGMREMIAPIRRETWTQHDPERRNRSVLAEDARRGLTAPPTQQLPPE